MYACAHAPVRVEIAGGGTDLPAWTTNRVGLCLNLAIDTHCHAVAITRPDHQVVAAYSQLERAAVSTEIANGLIRESALLHGWTHGFEVHVLSEVTSRGSGLGVSSAIAVCLGAVFRRMRRMASGDPADLPDAAAEAALDAAEIEIGRLRRPVGLQDAMAAAHGGLRLYAFTGTGATVDRAFSYEDSRWLADQIVLVRLPGARDAGHVLREVKAEHFQPSFEAVPVAIKAIETHSASQLGEALRMVRETKRAYGGETPEVAAVVDRVAAVSPGATVCGAGAGGHVVAIGTHEAIARATSLPVIRVAPDVLGVRGEGWR